MEAELLPMARGQAAESVARTQGQASLDVAAARGRADRFLALLDVYGEWPGVTRRRLEFEMLERVWPRICKYIAPDDTRGDEIELWFVEPDVAARLPGGAFDE